VAAVVLVVLVEILGELEALTVVLEKHHQLLVHL
jgi:hypothetical protein